VTPDALQAELLPIFREEANERLDEIVSALLELEAGRGTSDAVDVLFRHAHSLKGSAGMVGLPHASSIAHSLEDMLERIRSEDASASELVEPMLDIADALREAIGGSARSESAAGAEPDPVPAVVAPAPPESNATASPPESTAPRTLRIGAEKVDRALDAVGEAVLNHRRIEHILAAPAAGDDGVVESELNRGGRLLSELEDAVLAMRSLPLSTISAAYPRMVRDAAREAGVQAELTISGADTQLDRALLDGLGEALGHVLRNAVAHGIESPEERERAGKPRCGQIQLHSEPRGALVAIEVRDDGRGVSEAALAQAAGGSIVDVLAAPGFTTADRLTALSGRGVGLDAVKAHVEGIGGVVELTSEPGRGTCVTLLLPLTLAVMRVLIVGHRGRRFGVPLTTVAEAVAVDRLMTLSGRASIEVRGQRLWLSDLARVLDDDVADLDDAAFALVVGTSQIRAAIGCDTVLGEQEVVVKPLGLGFDQLPGYLGAAILGDGGIVLILDPATLVRRAVMPSTAARSSTRGAAPRSAPRILVVDDQFTVRELQRSILGAAGYIVETACDGREALDTLRGGGQFELVVTDLQMPRMDGLELLTAIRASGEHAQLPVVVVTSQGTPEDRARGAQAGADAYVVKDEFDQRALLATIADLIGRDAA
jgi:two-component system chemotaxis sensor kinase CheA